MLQRVGVAGCLLWQAGSRLDGATVPNGFRDLVVTGGLFKPTAMEFAPDGRLFVCQQSGEVRVIKNLSLLDDPALTVTTDFSGERGLLGLAFHPGFVTNHFLFVYYTATTPTLHNRVSRFTADGDQVMAGSEQVMLDLEILDDAHHNGGAIHFGGDGRLYVATGENGVPANAQSLSSRLGKILRLNADGSIPSDNPFFGVADGENRSIWALGLRNPFTFAFQPGTKRMFINDVGEGAWEEINDGVRGANYGWPGCEGRCSPGNPALRDPIHQYDHGGGCDITGGAFYDPVASQYPPVYRGNYFFADYCGGWIRRLDPANGNAVTPFASSLPGPVDLKVSQEGRLYYLARGNAEVRAIEYTNSPPRLGLGREGSKLTVVWPAPAQGYGLQAASSLRAGPAWSSVTNLTLVTNGQSRVLLDATSAARFYRLAR